MAKVEGLRSGYAKVGDLVYFGRMLDKIRLSEQSLLPPDYNLGDHNPLFFDGVCCRFLHVEYGQITDQVRAGSFPTKRSWNGLTKQGDVHLWTK
jgi:Domain of unknown function (DUF5069)